MHYKYTGVYYAVSYVQKDGDTGEITVHNMEVSETDVLNNYWESNAFKLPGSYYETERNNEVHNTAFIVKLKCYLYWITRVLLTRKDGDFIEVLPHPDRIERK